MPIGARRNQNRDKLRALSPEPQEPIVAVAIDLKGEFGGGQMGKIMIGVAAAALWFMLSHAVNTHRISPQYSAQQTIETHGNMPPALN